jgi:hypothetical protein
MSRAIPTSCGPMSKSPHAATGWSANGFGGRSAVWRSALLLSKQNAATWSRSTRPGNFRKTSTPPPAGVRVRPSIGRNDGSHTGIVTLETAITASCGDSASACPHLAKADMRLVQRWAACDPGCAFFALDATTSLKIKFRVRLYRVEFSHRLDPSLTSTATVHCSARSPSRTPQCPRREHLIAIAVTRSRMARGYWRLNQPIQWRRRKAFAAL